jgi:hypothetical protein
MWWGDFFESWQFKYDDILKENRDILDFFHNIDRCKKTLFTHNRLLYVRFWGS